MKNLSIFEPQIQKHYYAYINKNMYKLISLPDAYSPSHMVWFGLVSLKGTSLSWRFLIYTTWLECTIKLCVICIIGIKSIFDCITKIFFFVFIIDWNRLIYICFGYVYICFLHYDFYSFYIDIVTTNLWSMPQVNLHTFLNSPRLWKWYIFYTILSNSSQI